MLQSIMRGFLSDFSRSISDLSDLLVAASVEIYERVSVDLLPTPAKSHYVFNLRDLSKCVQGMLQADAVAMRDASDMLRYIVVVSYIHTSYANRKLSNHFVLLIVTL